MHESILAFRKRRYLWVALGVIGASFVAYWIHDPQEPPNGGTWLGYTLGVVGAGLIVWLTWFGVRKRRYASTAGTVQGWLSAHVYLGMALVVVSLLHSGFQYGWNVHTLALVLMLVVVISGAYGVFVYLKYPQRISENRGGVSNSELLMQLEDLDKRSVRAARDLPPEYAEFVDSGIRRTQLGATLWQRLRNDDQSRIVLPGGDPAGVTNAGQEAALDWLAEKQSTASDPDVAAKIGELSALLRNKRRLMKQLAVDLKLQASLEIWLFVHVPMTAALLVALFAHILVVFLYW
ncbi:MAG: hypothetical protein AAFN50_00345 [Pseudomonadota bacterium]